MGAPAAGTNSHLPGSGARPPASHAVSYFNAAPSPSKDITRAAYRPQENAILQPHGTAGRTHDPARLRFPHAKGCTFCGFCFQGCIEPPGSPRNLRAKRSTDNSYMPMALTAELWHRGGKAATLLTDAYVTQIHTTTSGGQTVATGVTWRDNATGQTSSEDAKVVVMSGGCVENPRLWLNSQLPNPNGWVGRGFTDHYFDWIIGLMPYDIGSSRGPGSNARCDFPGYGGLEQVGIPPALQAFSATFSDAGIAGFYDNGAKAAGVRRAGADSLGRVVGKELLELVSHVDRMLNVLVITDDDVEPQNRVTLSTELPPDEHGPVPRVEVSSPQSQRAHGAKPRVHGRQGGRAGQARWRRARLPPRLAAADPARAVDDADGRRSLELGPRRQRRGPMGQASSSLTTRLCRTATAARIPP